MKGLFGLGKNKSDKKPSEKPAQSSYKKYLVQYDRKGCIGAGICEAMNPELWKVLDTKKAELKDSALNEQNQMFELYIDESEFEKMKAAAEGCPKLVIHIINMDTGEKII